MHSILIPICDTLSKIDPIFWSIESQYCFSPRYQALADVNHT